MRKILASIMALTMIFSIFASINVFAADYTIELGTPVEGETTATIPVIINAPTGEDYWIDSVQLDFSLTNCTLKQFDITSGSDMSARVGTERIELGTAADGYDVEVLAGNNFVIGTLTVEKTADNATISLKDTSWANDSISEWLTSSTDVNTTAVELWKSAPVAPVVKDIQVSDKGTTLELGGKTWTGLEVWEVSATVEGSAGTLTCTLSAEYTEDGTPAAAPKALNAGSVIAHLEGATVTFRAAIVNMDEGIEITSLTPEFVVAAQ